VVDSVLVWAIFSPRAGLIKIKRDRTPNINNIFFIFLFFTSQEGSLL
jgi:hypothetical protein